MKILLNICKIASINYSICKSHKENYLIKTELFHNDKDCNFEVEQYKIKYLYVHKNSIKAFVRSNKIENPHISFCSKCKYFLNLLLALIEKYKIDKFLASNLIIENFDVPINLFLNKGKVLLLDGKLFMRTKTKFSLLKLKEEKGKLIIDSDSFLEDYESNNDYTSKFVKLSDLKVKNLKDGKIKSISKYISDSKNMSLIELIRHHYITFIISLVCLFLLYKYIRFIFVLSILILAIISSYALRIILNGFFS